MLGAARLSLVPAIIAAWLFLPVTAYAIVPQVHDNGKFFTPETVKKANDLLLRIQEKHKKDVVVETFGEIPEKVLQRIKYDPKNRRSFFEQWAKDIAKEGKVDGIVILVAKDQNHNNSTWIEVDAGESTRAKSFRSADLTDLHRIFENGWSKDRNAVLVEGLQFTDSRMAAHHGTGSTPQQTAKKSASGTSVAKSSEGSGIWGWVCIGVCAIAGIWLVFGLVRAFSGGGASAGGAGHGGGGYGGGYGGGGGGFMSGLMGGLFGAMAGNWIYNNMFGGHSSWGGSTAHAGESPASGRDDFGPSDQGQGFSGVGGDVDGGKGGDVDGGGGDWGSGGGDTGGGDAGGGGDWGGGGGGDFGGGGGDFGGGGGGGDW